MAFNTKLIYDSDPGGHHSEHLEYLIQHLEKKSNKETAKFIFLVHPILSERLIQRFPGDTPVEIHSIPENELKKYATGSGPLERSLREWEYLGRFVKEYSVDELIFMIIDRYQYLIGSRRYRQTGISTSGILFNPFVRIPIIHSNIFTSMNESIRRFKKWILIRWMLQNSKLKSIFILNDEFTAENLEKIHSRKERVFFDLPDPIPSRKSTSQSSNLVVDEFGIDSGRKVLLAFGEIAPRKNLENILDALCLMPDNLKDKISLLIVGKCKSEEYENNLKKKINKLTINYPHLQLKYYNKFVSDQVRDYLFEAADIILAIYLHFYSSSGIIGHAARFGKPVVVSNYGLMNSLVTKYGLGEVAEPDDKRSIKESLLKLYINEEGYSANYDLFLSQRTPSQFAKKLLSPTSD